MPFSEVSQNLHISSPEPEKRSFGQEELITAQVALAQKLSQFLDIPVADAIAWYTPMYRRVVGTGMGPGMETSEEWKAFTSGISRDSSPAEAAKLILQRHDEEPSRYRRTPNARDRLRAAIPQSLSERDPKKPTVHFGSLHYDYYDDDNVVDLHFWFEGDTAGFGGLSNDFRDLLADVRSRHSDAQRVEGCSWLLDPRLGAVARRWLTPELAASVTPMAFKSAFRSGSLWGQFYRAEGGLDRKRLQTFTESVARATSAAEIMAAFPYWPHKMEGSLDRLYERYRVEDSQMIVSDAMQ